MKIYAPILLAGLLAASVSALSASLVSDSPSNATVYFIHPQDGETVGQPVTVVFGLANMGVAPAGVERENTGHHHLLIDTVDLPDLTQPLPATEKIKHFGGGQTQAEITLEPGKHTLQLLLGNYAHVPHREPVMSKKITINVSESEE